MGRLLYHEIQQLKFRFVTSICLFRYSYELFMMKVYLNDSLRDARSKPANTISDAFLLENLA